MRRLRSIHTTLGCLLLLGFGCSKKPASDSKPSNEEKGRTFQIILKPKPPNEDLPLGEADVRMDAEA